MATPNNPKDPARKPGQPAREPAPRPDDDLELRPLQHLNADADDVADAPVLAPSVAPAPRPAAAPLPEGMVACASCMALTPQAQAILMPDGRLLCPTCQTDFKRRHAREESRLAAAEGEGAWFDFPEATAWLLTALVPVGAYVLFYLLMTLMRSTHTLPPGHPSGDALMLLAVTGVQSLIVFAALGIAGMIFGGLDLPSLPNVLWKVLGVLTVDVAVFVWFVSMWQTTAFMLPAYLVIVRPLFMGIALVFLLGLELVEGAITTLIAWASIWLMLLSALARGFLFTGLPGAN